MTTITETICIVTALWATAIGVIIAFANMIGV